MTLDILYYFEGTTGLCTYTQCSIVDDSDNPIPWLKDASLSGNICSFKVDTSTLQAQTNFHIKLTSATASPLTVTSNTITYKVVDLCLDSS